MAPHASTEERIVRSVQQHVDDSFSPTPSVRIFQDGEDFDPSALSECAQLWIGPIEWEPTTAPNDAAMIEIEMRLYCRRSTDPHRLSDLAGQARAALHRNDVVIYDYPGSSPTQVGLLRLFDATVHHVPMPADEPVRHVEVTVEGRYQATT